MNNSPAWKSPKFDEAKRVNYFEKIDNAVNIYRQKFKKEEEEL